jgi:ATP-dependent Clp protease ATP-binding subunit ClpA
MSAYQMRENIPQLIGSIETGNPGLLTSAVREHPYGVLLLDELEKADKNLLNIFLTILDEGYYTDGFGKRVDCKNLIIIATSNAGAELFYLNSTSSPTQTSLTQLDLVNHLIQSHIYTPEFLNRFDGIIMYRPLQSEGATQLAKKMQMSITEQLKSIYHINISVTDNTLNTIVSKSYDPAFGARDMERVLRKEIEDNIAKMILANQIKEGDSIQL